MAYSIGYGPQYQRKYVQEKSNLCMLTALFFVIFMLSVHIFWQDGAQMLRQMLLPMQEDTVASFEAMITQISEGIAVSDAVTAFCQDVIDHAARP